ncbi:MAG: hypothetical protein K6F42_00010 [Bacteroidales bacterium]|nr:hypothetical protein [Bacteroidales bacterium]
MKKVFKFIMAIAFGALVMSCEGNRINTGLTTKEKAMKAAVEEYVPGVVYDIYGKLADETENLYKQLAAMKGAASVSSAQVNAACATFLSARSWWEKSEAFLFGAATSYGIDPHIDSWPLDLDALSNALSNAGAIGALDSDGAAAVGYVGASALGFHGIEFILFRDGAARDAACFSAAYNDEALGADGKTELIFATAVAEDLRNYCFELQASWDPGCPADRVALVEDELELNTVMDSGLTFGENLLRAGEAGSTYRTWQYAVSSILVAGCSNICNEVANTKIGTAYYAAADDAEAQDYIESPYSKKSYVDFKDNILSIQYSLYGSNGATAASRTSLMSFLKDHGYAKAAELESALKAAVASLDACINSGVAFVDDKKAAVAGTAIEKINALDELLNDAADWVAKL